MTYAHFVAKSAFRNRRRTLLTIVSVALSLLLLVLMAVAWRAFYVDQASAEAAQRLVTRNRVSMIFAMPAFYRDRIRGVPHVTAVVPVHWFGGIYKNDRAENTFPQIGTDPRELLNVYRDYRMPRDQVEAWQHDRAGAIVDHDLAAAHGWTIGQKIVIKGTILPVDLNLTIRGIFTAPTPTETLYFDHAYVEETLPATRASAPLFAVLVDAPANVAPAAAAIDDMFRNSSAPTATEGERVFLLSFLTMLGNVKTFILSVCLAVMFTTLLVSTNTMAMTIRERTREIAVLQTLGFTRGAVLAICVAEATVITVSGAILGLAAVAALLRAVARGGSPQISQSLAGATVTPGIVALALAVAAVLGVASAIVPSYRSIRLQIVDGLRHIG
jgi:putative ABC transport system permease protein